ncbi:MAG: hypothetical protein WDN24_21800 [Sphingomonas sp.]
MTRHAPAAAALLLLAACAPARPADVIAYYVREGAGPVTVRASANGDARVEAGGRVYIRRGGANYVVLKDGKGRFAAREVDYAALLAERAEANALPGPRAEPDYEASADGTELVAGVRGTLWKVHPRHIPSLTSLEAVVSEDPALAAAAQGLALETRLAVAANSAAAGGPGSFEKAMTGLFEKGLVVRMGNALKLDRIDPGPVSPADFALPAVLDRAALKARLAAAR